MRQTESRYEDLLSDKDKNVVADLDQSISGSFEVVEDITEPGSTENPGPAARAFEAPEEFTPNEWQIYHAALAAPGEGGKLAKHKRGLNHIVSWARGAVKVVKQPKRVLWAMKDKERFSKGIDIVHILVGHLTETLAQDKMKDIHKDTQEIRLAMVVMNKTLGDILALQQAAQISTGATSDTASAVSWGGTTQVEEIAAHELADGEGTLLSESRFKAFTQQLFDFSIQIRVSTKTLLDPTLGDQKLEFPASRSHVASKERESATINGRPVWV